MAGAGYLGLVLTREVSLKVISRSLLGMLFLIVLFVSFVALAVYGCGNLLTDRAADGSLI